MNRISAGRTLLVILFFAICYNINGQALTAGQDSTMRWNTGNLFQEYFRYGRLTENSENISEHYVDRFKSFFLSDASIYDFLAGNAQLSLDDYVKMIRENFPYGLSFINIESESYNLRKTSDNKYVATVSGNMKIIAWDAGFTRKEFIQDVVITVVSDDLYKPETYRLAGINRTFVPPIQELKVKLVNPDNSRDQPSDVEIALMIDNTIFEKKKSQDGLVVFYSVPRESEYKIIMQENDTYTSTEPIEINPNDPDFKEEAAIQLFIRQVKRWSRISFAGDVNLNLTDINFGDAQLRGKHNLTGLNSFKPGYSINIEGQYYPVLPLPFLVGIGAGLGFSNSKFDIGVDNLFHQYDATDIDNDAYLHILSAGKVRFEGDLFFFSIPVSLTARYDLNHGSINAAWFSVRGIFSFPIKREYSHSGLFTSKGYYQGYNLMLEDIKQYNYLSNQKINESGTINETRDLISMLQIGGGIEFNTGIPNLTAVVGLQYTTTLTDFIENRRKNDILTQDMIRLNNITSFTSQSRMNRYSLSLGVIYKLFR
jgi:hypothetical protein